MASNAEKSDSKSALSPFVRDAIREKASREISLLRAQLEAFESLRSTQGTLNEAAARLTSFLGALAAIGADTASIAKAKKVRKLLDEAKDGVDGLSESLALEAREGEARGRRDAIVAELTAAGITLEGVTPAPAEAAHTLVEAPAANATVAEPTEDAVVEEEALIAEAS